MKNDQKLVDLIQGIEDLLSKGRCPLTSEDKVLLKLCLTELKDLNNKKVDLLGSMEKVTKWLLLLFEIYEKFKDFY